VDWEAPGSPGVHMLKYSIICLQYRRQMRKIASHKYENRLEKKLTYEKSRPKESYQLNPIDEIFSGDTLQKASEIETQLLEGNVNEVESSASKDNRVKLKKKKSKQLKDSNKQDKKPKLKTDKQGKKFKKWKRTGNKNRGFVIQKAVPVDM
jgi:hypothetical protein